MEADPHSGAPEPTAVRSDIGAPVALSPAQLYRAADASALNFATTAELSPLDGLIGQQRARHDGDLPLPKLFSGAILASKPPGYLANVA